ncbi:hypothetical protein MA16_Dca004918 [Dendrobium catenatum]|uniref:Uncharacterized protein n=1 Tax=Dendrobium catenatum TaxID=906689 RepID=A0A2I0WGD5_9ASPA|nr:hypothetical protein MA16_Dca004918 [Dendrobium catenatum]
MAADVRRPATLAGEQTASRRVIPTPSINPRPITNSCSPPAYDDKCSNKVDDKARYGKALVINEGGLLNLKKPAETVVVVVATKRNRSWQQTVSQTRPCLGRAVAASVQQRIRNRSGSLLLLSHLRFPVSWVEMSTVKDIERSI